MTQWKKEPLHVSANGRYLMEGDQPFFWLGEAAWLDFNMFQSGHRRYDQDAVLQ